MSLGRANDKGVPEDEIVLAKALQSAKARRILPLRGSYYETKTPGDYVHLKDAVNRGDAVKCACAVGAYRLDEPKSPPLDYIVTGNDAGYGSLFGGDSFFLSAGDETHPGVTVGIAYQDAMSEG